MTFQFLCPQGHLLQGDESQAGQQCACPTCGTTFVIPAPQHAAQAQPGPAEHNPFDFSQGSAGGFPGAEDQGAPQVFPGFGGSSSTAAEKPFDTDAAAPKPLHIPCPGCKQQLETPGEMVGQDAVCPQCGTQFQLRYKDSIEAKRERAEERERRDLKRGKMWLQWAVAATIIVLTGLIVLIAMTMQGS